MSTNLTDIESIVRKYGTLKALRIPHEDSWDQIVYYTNPVGGYVQREEDDGDITSQNIYDNIAYDSLFRLASVLNSMLTPRSEKWFTLTTDDEDFNDTQLGKEWLRDVEDILLKIFEGSNFYSEVQRYFYDLVSIGTSVMYIDDDDDPDIIARFSTRHIREIYIAENKYGDVDTVYRVSVLTAKQCYDRWGDKVSKSTRKMYEETPFKEIEVLHAVEPKDGYAPQSEMPYTSVWIELNERHVLAEGGYKVCPYTVSRWFQPSGVVYATSPMHLSLPNVISLQRMMEVLIEGAELSIKPPLKGTPDLSDAQDEIVIESGRVIIVDPKVNGNISPIWEMRQPQIGMEAIQILRDQISSILMGNQLSVIDRSNMTAAEVRARVTENNRVIGPTSSRIQSDFLSKLIERVYNIALDRVDTKGKPVIPESPVETDGTLNIELVSPMTKMQRVPEITAIQETIAFAMQLVEIRPAILDNIDFDEALKIISDVNGVAPTVMKDKELVKQVRQARVQQQQQQQQQEQQQMQMQQEAHKADTLGKLAEAKRRNGEANNRPA